MLDKIEKQLKKLLKKTGVTGEFEFGRPPKSGMGDIAFACFGFAKEQKKNPAEVAKEIAEKLKLKISKSKLFDRVEAFGPYVNFYLNTSELTRLTLVKVAKKDFGKNNFGKGKKVLIEYPSQNTHKEFHIGHLRNVCIGNCLVELYKKSGYDITAINYVNDFGRHVVKVLWYILRSQKSKVQNPKLITNKQKWLGEIYAEASAYIAEHKEEVAPELDELQKKLESRDPEVMKLFEETRQWSIDGFAKIMDELEVDHNKIIYESEIKDRGQKIVDDLLDKKIAMVGEGGAIIIDLQKYNLDIALLRKSSGAGLYLTSDLALAEKKFTDFSVNESINITGTEQNHYFQQLFKVLWLYGFQHKMTHIGYGLVNLPSGKMSSRAGNVILYEDLRDEVFEKLKKETCRRHETWGEEKINNNTQILTMAVLKFSMQKHESNKVVTFDMAEALSFDGYSAPYVLYAVARINSLLAKSKIVIKKMKFDFSLVKEEEEKKILLLIADYDNVIKKALADYNPSVIARYCFELAQAFNDFYNRHSVLGGENKDLQLIRLALSKAVKDVLTSALSILTIDTVEEM